MAFNAIKDIAHFLLDGLLLIPILIEQILLQVINSVKNSKICLSKLNIDISNYQ